MRVKIGSHKSPGFAEISGPGCRTQAQLDAVMKIHADVPSAWWVWNPFQTSDNPMFVDIDGNITHMFIDIEGRRCAALIAPDGVVGKTIVFPPELAEQAKLAVYRFGAFTGSNEIQLTASIHCDKLENKEGK